MKTTDAEKMSKTNRVFRPIDYPGVFAYIQHYPFSGCFQSRASRCILIIMALLSKEEIAHALTRLGELAQNQGTQIDLLAVGGAVMVLAYQARPATHDVDVFILSPKEARVARELAERVAQEMGWPADWLNDGAKGYLVGLSQGPIIFTAPGIVVRRPSLEQLLAMKLSAWRDDVDIEDARRLLSEMKGVQDEIWRSVEPFLLPGQQLKAQYAFLDLWETLNDNAD
jgi:hypothetical protein